jgi:hypothetical protein
MSKNSKKYIKQPQDVKVHEIHPGHQEMLQVFQRSHAA